MTDLELDLVLTVRWPAVMRRVMADSAAPDFAKSFVRSIARSGKRRTWRPSSKQERIMRQMVADYGHGGEPEPELIEGG